MKFERSIVLGSKASIMAVVAMLCLLSLVLGMECLAFKGYALCISLLTSLNGTLYKIAQR